MRYLPAKGTRTLEAVARRVVPAVATLEPARRDRFLAIIDAALGDRPPSMRRQLATFLGLIRVVPAARYGRRFEKLGPGHQDAVLAWLERAPVGLLRKGFWGLKVLAFMGYYGQLECWSEIGYAPERDGNARLDARA